MQRERDFGGFKYFSKISYPLPPLESQLDPPINAVFAPSLINRLTHPQHIPPEQKAQWLENENEAKSRCQRGTPKNAPLTTPWPRHWRTAEFIQSLFLNSSLSLSFLVLLYFVLSSVQFIVYFT